jgi:hypothetical protein
LYKLSVAEGKTKYATDATNDKATNLDIKFKKGFLFLTTLRFTERRAGNCFGTRLCSL